MLHHSRMVSHSIQVIQLYRGKPVESFFCVLRRKRGARIPQPFVVDAFKTSHVLLRYPVPHHVSRVQISAFSHGVPFRLVIQKCNRLFRYRVRIIKGYKCPALAVQQLDRV